MRVTATCRFYLELRSTGSILMCSTPKAGAVAGSDSLVGRAPPRVAGSTKITKPCEALQMACTWAGRAFVDLATQKVWPIFRNR